MAGNTDMEKSKGLKDHKKAQKAKIAEKRAAAAPKSKISKAEIKVEPVVKDVAQEAVPSRVEDIHQEEPAGNKSSVLDVVLVEQESGEYKSTVLQRKPLTDITPAASAATDTDIHPINTDLRVIEHITPTEDAPTQEVIDIKAYRKALEAELYANMESPKEMFARINRVVSATTEYHCEIVNTEEYDNFDECIASSTESERAIDSNGFECVAARYITLEDALVDASTEVSDTEPTNTLIDEVSNNYIKVFSPFSLNQLLAKASATVAALKSIDNVHIDECAVVPVAEPSIPDMLFSKAAKSGGSIVGTSSAEASCTLKEVEEQQTAAPYEVHSGGVKEHSFSPSMSIGQLFAAVKVEGTPVVRLPAATDSSPGQSITLLCGAPKAEDTATADLPAGAGDSVARAHRAHACVAAGLTLRCKEEILMGLFLDEPAVTDSDIVSPIEARDLSKAARDICCTMKWGGPDVTTGDAQEEVVSVAEAQSQEAQKVLKDSEKLMAMLGAGDCVPPSNCAPKNGVNVLNELFAVARARAASESSAHTNPPSLSAGEQGYYTPTTHNSVSPPPFDNQCFPQSNSYNFAANGCAPGWVPNMGAFHPSPHGFQQPGFGYALFSSEPFQGYCGYAESGPPVFSDFVPGQSYHVQGSMQY